jgi:hypothetical protein
MIDALSGIAFALVFVSLLTRWINPLAKYWYMPLVVSCFIALKAGLINAIGFTFPALLLLLVFFKLHDTVKQSAIRIVIDIAITALCFILALHAAPGFHNIPIVDNAVIKSSSIPYSLYLNYDKALAGVFLIACFLDVSQTGAAVKRIAAWIGIGVSANLLLVFLPALALDAIAVNIETPDVIGAWLVSNLMITCVAEEAFFRGLIQQRLEQFLNTKNILSATAIALFITSLLFGIAHLRGGWLYVAMATVAGLIYGLVYIKTRRIETAILTPYLTNTIHILFFSYPMLAQS